MIKSAEDKFKEASEAYGILSDKNKKENYDNFGHAAFENGGRSREALVALEVLVDQIFQIFLKIFLEILVVEDEVIEEIQVIEAQI